MGILKLIGISLIITTIIYIVLMTILKTIKGPTEEEKQELERLEKLIPDEELFEFLESYKNLSMKEAFKVGEDLAKKYDVTPEELLKRIREFEKKN